MDGSIPFFVGGRGGGGVCAQFVHGRSCVAIDPPIPTRPGRSTSGFHQPVQGAMDGWIHCFVRKGGRGYSVFAWPQSYDHRPSHPYYVGPEYIGFSPTRQALLAPSAKHREVFGESHEG